jgi:hypothetical protein
VGDLNADMDKQIAAAEEFAPQQNRGPSTRAFALAQDDNKKKVPHHDEIMEPGAPLIAVFDEWGSFCRL